jgi:predicted O-methyltransferase YrrM
VVNAVLERLYREQSVVHRDGKRRPLCPPGITVDRGEYLFRLVRALRPSVTLEVGFAYGVSTLFIVEALRQNGAGRHIAIDPNERRRFDGLGLAHLEEAGLSSWVTFREEPAELCLPRLVAEGVRLDLAFDDSGHLFDHVITEFVFLARLLRTGAPLVFDDAGLPGVDRACRFIATNRPDFAEVVDGAPRGLLRSLFDRHPIPPPPVGPRGTPLMRVFRKVADDDPRDWNDYAPF